MKQSEDWINLTTGVEASPFGLWVKQHMIGSQRRSCIVLLGKEGTSKFAETAAQNPTQ
jgi:hypothetical protein